MRLDSYDLFDTLITRVTRRPVDVFRLLGATAAVRFRWKAAGIIPFHVWRRRAERLARWRSSREDVELKDIYRVLAAVIHQPSRVMRTEIALEEAAIRPLPTAVNQLTALQNSGIPCCIISDMYLPHTVLRRFVRKHISDTPLYVSSKIGLTKTSGRLFHHVAQSHQVPLAAIHHRGDNPFADYAVPLRLGMQATLVPVPTETSAISVLDTLKCPREGDPFYEMGFRLAGPTAFVMAALLADHVAEHAPPNVIFAARDMHLVKHAFHLLSAYPSTSYCRISRSAVYRAQWHASNDPQRWFEGVATGRDFFKRLGLRCPDDLLELAPHQHARRFLSALKESDFPSECSIEYSTVRSYLINEGFQSGTLFVDLGWRGSIQDAVNEILTPTTPVTGWYFGTLERTPTKQGIYFDGSKPLRHFHRVLQAVSFFEFLFTEAVPSVARIIRDGEGFAQIGTEDETEAQRDSRIQIAEGAKDFIELMAQLHKTAGFQPQRLLGSLDQLYDRYLMIPPEHWVTALDSMTHSGGFGGSANSPLIGDNTATPLGFLKAPWKGGYIVKHKASRWHILFQAMHRTTFFVAYDALKREVRRRRAARLYS